MKLFRSLILGSAMVLTGLMTFARPARAIYVLTVGQQGSDVVATGSGTLDLTDLTNGGPNSVFGGPNVFPNTASFGVGGANSFISGTYYAGVAGPSSFGSGPDCR